MQDGINKNRWQQTKVLSDVQFPHLTAEYKLRDVRAIPGYFGDGAAAYINRPKSDEQNFQQFYFW